MNNIKLVVVGGVAGGASCAARARRLSEEAEIIMIERGSYVSFANCGLPYYIGNVIKEEEDLLIATPERFRERFNIDVRTDSVVRSIDKQKKEIEIENRQTGETYTESYDKLVLSPGAAPLRPDIEGIDLPGIFALRSIPDMRDIIHWKKEKNVKNAVVVGGGYIGLEMAENLENIGIKVTIVEMQQHVMPVLDPEIAAFVHDHLESKQVIMHLGSAATRFSQNGDGRIAIALQTGETIETDMVILSIGVRPETGLAESAGLAIGERGGITVNDRMQTSIEDIYAVGDAVEVDNFINGSRGIVALAGPANRQGRIAADVIMGSTVGMNSFRGAQATAVCGVMGLTVATTGLTEKMLKALQPEDGAPTYEKVYLHPYQHAGYYPNPQEITTKLLFSAKDGRILGAQAVGLDGVDKRIDVIAMAIQLRGTVADLLEAELCYAPQFGSAKDPVNMAGMIASNVVSDFSPTVHWENLAETDAYILDVRTKEEFEKGYATGAVNLPLDSIRDRMGEIPKDREIWAYCQQGQRSYFTVRILRQNGFNVRNLSGGYMMYLAVKRFKDIP